MLTGQVDELVWTLVIAAAYLLIVRLLDVNEREPLWSVALFFALGGAAGTLMRLTVDSTLLDLTVWPAAATEQAATFIAIAAGLGILAAVSRTRGWSEVTGLVDGVVYGVAVGLGFACGETIARWMATSPSAGLDALAEPAGVVWRAALAGLANGVFGGITGAGFGLAVEARGRAIGGLAVVAAFGVAIAADAGHHVLAFGNALGGSAGLARAWAALLLPVVGLAAVGLYGLAVERRAIGEHLAEEVSRGGMTQADLDLLRSFTRRHLAYGAAVAGGRFARMWHLTTLHNLQVMLALTRRREGREVDQVRRARFEQEVAALRARIAAMQERTR
jgi:protease PrsW